MRVPSDSYDTKKRPLRKLQRLQALLAQALPEPRNGGRGASAAKIARLRAAVAAVDGDYGVKPHGQRSGQRTARPLLAPLRAVRRHRPPI
jgi:hypothetical protein